MNATASIATRETDEILREKYKELGRRARQEGKWVTDCPWSGGVAQKWWLEGWKNQDMIINGMGV